MEAVWEEILILRFEGGRVTLMGQKQPDGQWVFVKETNESVLFDEEDEGNLNALLQTKSSVIHSWEEAIKSLGAGWERKRPAYVHPEFEELVPRQPLRRRPRR
ncbi:hypothetical protein [Exiguobacterium antarcticum]|uniref:hypothetical protein n=1 Tax=Exiguobacterium antarcticum TaxID=132920 RepID=UPI00059C8812|nr:hypothetical protein [Exiguobacterium antarcticum]